MSPGVKSSPRPSVITGYADAEQMLRVEEPDLVHLVAMPDQWRELMPMGIGTGVFRRASLKNRLPAVSKTGVSYASWRHRPLLNSALVNSTGGIPTSSICRQVVERGELGKIRLLDFSCGMNLTAQGTHIIDWAMSLNNDSPIVRVFVVLRAVPSRLIVATPLPTPHRVKSCLKMVSTGFGYTGFTSRRVMDDDTIYKHCRVAAYGENGHILFEEFSGWEISTTRLTESGVQTPDSWRAKNDLAQARLTEGDVRLDCGRCPSSRNESKTCITPGSMRFWASMRVLFLTSRLTSLFDPPDNLDFQLHEALSRS